MLSEKEVEEAIRKITDRLDDINRLFIKKVAKQVLIIGELSPSSINRLMVMRDMGADVAEVTEQLRLATAMNVKDVFKLYQKALTDVYTDKRFKEFLKQSPLPVHVRNRLTNFAQGVSVQTAQTMYNISNTTAISSTYQNVIDTAIISVSSGLTDYQSAIRSTIQQIGYNGLQVYYASGYHRRLDTAIRQNVIDGVNQIAQNSSLAMGEALGFDAVELSAHLNSAPDHEPVQGRVFLKAEFEKMQNGEDFVDVDGNRYAGFRRPIGEWNCMHIAMSFSTQHSVRRYSEEQLREWAVKNHEGCKINGKQVSIYAARQYMRQLETEVRRQKDTANTARQFNDDVLRRKCQERINVLTKKYYDVAKTAGLTPDGARLSVVGFKAVKV